MAKAQGSMDPPLTLGVGQLATPEVVKATLAFCCEESVHYPLWHISQVSVFCSNKESPEIEENCVLAPWLGTP